MERKKPERINGLIYDLEIANIIPTKSEKKLPQYKYCGGWEDHKGMGIACVCAYDMWEMMPRIFTSGNFAEMMELFNSREEIIGYNSIHFDDKVMNALGFKVKTTYDLLVQLRFIAGEPDKWERGVSRGGFKLDQILADNKLPLKSGEGKLAPMQWQTGQHGKVIDYCMGDVMATYRLFKKRRAIYVGSYDKTFNLKEPPSLRAAYEAEVEARELAERQAFNYDPTDAV